LGGRVAAREGGLNDACSTGVSLDVRVEARGQGVHPGGQSLIEGLDPGAELRPESIDLSAQVVEGSKQPRHDRPQKS
jgi:hypothetical protein